MTTKTHYAVKIAKNLNLEAWLYFFIYRGFREISKKYGVRISTNNYGYYPTKFDNYDKYQLQMYDEYANLMVDENIKEALEIGSGAGGGLMHMQSRLPQTQFTGLDRCKEAVKTCKFFFDESQSSFNFYSDINHILSDGKRFNAIVSVETGIYTKPDIFDDIHELLDENGVFIYYDNATVGKLDGIIQSIESSGFKIDLLKDITENVFKACEHDTPRRQEVIEKYLPKYLKPFRSELLRYMCVKGSSRYIKFSNGKKRSFMLKARKINHTVIIN